MLSQLPPSARSVLLNIGSFTTPLLPPEDNETVVAVALEPVVASQITPAPRLFVVPAAVSDASGLAMMGVFNLKGESSSLSKPAQRRPWNVGSKLHEPRLVPVLRMRDVLHSIPSDLLIWFLKTDMQGHDFKAVASAGQQLAARVPYIMSEVYLENMHSYSGTRNDYCTDWLPFSVPRTS